jgi:hypothetical protein
LIAKDGRKQVAVNMQRNRTTLGEISDALRLWKMQSTKLNLLASGEFYSKRNKRTDKSFKTKQIADIFTNRKETPPRIMITKMGQTVTIVGQSRYTGYADVGF